MNGNVFAIQNPNDTVFTGITDAAQRSSVNLAYTPVPGTTTGEVQTAWDFVSQFTPVESTYPNGGSLVIAGVTVAGLGSSRRFQISLPAYAGYTYEVYRNPTLGDLAWSALPFALSPAGAIDTNKITASSEGTLNVYLEAKAAKGFYYVAFRVPGANTGVP